VRAMNEFSCEGLKPDLTLFLDVLPETARARRQDRERVTQTEADRIERAGEAFHARLREGFRELAGSEPDRIVTIDANGTVDEVWEKVWTSTRRFL